MTITAENLKDSRMLTVRPEAEPSAVQIDVWLGDLYLGQRTFYGYSSVKKAKDMALRYIKNYGSLN